MKNYEFKKSSAIYSIKIKESRVIVVYNSNIDKEYEFDCQNSDKFDEKVSKTLQNKESIGKLVHSCIKQQELVAVTK